jgi:hypothetical protein
VLIVVFVRPHLSLMEIQPCRSRSTAEIRRYPFVAIFVKETPRFLDFWFILIQIKFTVFTKLPSVAYNLHIFTVLTLISVILAPVCS